MKSGLWTSRRFRFQVFRSQVSKSQHGMLGWACPLSVEADDMSVALNVWRMFAVGTVVANRPPHRSVRAEFPHTAPTLSV